MLISPLLAGLYLDAYAALDYLLKRSDLNHQKIVIFGRSLGGAVAIKLCAQYAAHVHSLILENTFTSLPDIGKHLLDFKFIKCLPNICFKNKVGYVIDEVISLFFCECAIAIYFHVLILLPVSL